MFKLSNCEIDGTIIKDFNGDGHELNELLTGKDNQMYLEKMVSGKYKIGYTYKDSGRFMELTNEQAHQLFHLMYNDKDFYL